MADRRLSMGKFLGVWALLVALQALAFVGPLAALPDAARVGWVLAIQLIKVVPTAWRLSDTGRDPSDAPFLAWVPLVNILGFFQRMLETTPSEAVRERRQRTWKGRLGAFAALAEGTGLAAKTASLSLPLVLLYALGSTIGGRFMLGRLAWADELSAETLDLLNQGLWLGVALLGLYTVLQIGKRRQVSRASWAPSLLLGPTLLLALSAMLVRQGQTGEFAPVLLSMLVMSWGLVWATFGGAALAVGIILLGDGVTRNAPVPAGELFRQIRARTLDVAGPRGARVHAIYIGMQVVIPGIFYALQLAFTDMIAVLEPDEPALSRSGRLTWGMRSRLFKVFFVWAVVCLGLSSGAILLLQDPEALTASLFDARALSLPSYLIQEIIWALGSWVLTLALLRMYQDRLLRLDPETSGKVPPPADPEAFPADA